MSKLLEREEKESQNRIEVWERRVSDLKKQSENYKVDCDILGKQKKELESELKGLKQSLSSILDKALSKEREELKNLRDIAGSNNKSAIEQKNRLSDESSTLKADRLEVEKQKNNLAESIKKSERINQENLNTKQRLSALANTIIDSL